MLSDFERLNAALTGRYALEREIGRGGMATVYLARDLKHQREVALKVLRPELAVALNRDRFLREISVAARLNHPHILPLYDSGDADGFLFYVMPHVRGESLRQKLEREKHLPVDAAIDITRQVAAALHYAHAQDVIHRDIKPENILLHEGEAMVADFGIALAVSTASSERLTGTGLSLGTPEYMSPEQALGERAPDARSDIYSLGCVLYELLAGEPPFTGASALAVISKRLSDTAPDVRRLRESVPAPVDRALRTALARVPADRFASVAAFADALSEPKNGNGKSGAVAVLPFLNLSPDPDNEYFADGITEDVIAQLSKIRALKVISRTSVMPFKKREQGLREIASRLGASKLLDGSVRRASDRVRIVAQLVDADTDQYLWAETYDRQLTDVFAIQSEVALHIASALEAELSPDEQTRIQKEPTHNVQAYQLYLQGRHHYVRFTTEGMLKSIEYFERALQLDPNYALAHAAVGVAYVELGETGSLKPEQAYRPAREAATRALALDNNLADAHTTLGVLKVAWEFDWPGAEQEYKRALELNPNSADTLDFYARLCSATGRFDEALDMVRRAQELDPLAHRSDLINALLRAGRNEEAVAEGKRALDFDPAYDRARATLAWAYILSGQQETGIAELEKASALSPDNTTWQAQLGQAYALAGREGEARQILKRLEELSARQYVSPYHLAYVYTGLREYDHALDWLEKAYEERSGAIYGLKGSFLFRPLHAHPRFQALLKKMNLA